MNERKPATKFLTLTLSPWVYVTIIALLIAPFLIAVLNFDQIFNSYVRTYLGPEVRRQFGFRMEHQTMYYRQAQRLDVFVITTLEPDGVLARAGVRNDDVPLVSGWFHMSDVNFYRRLQEGRKGPIELRLIGRDEYEYWLKTGGRDTSL